MAVKTSEKAEVFTSADFRTASATAVSFIVLCSGQQAAENELFCWFSSNYNVEVHAYVKNKKYCVVNNTYEHRTLRFTQGMERALTFIWKLMRSAGIRSEKAGYRFTDKEKL